MSDQLMEIKALAWRAFIHSKRTPMVVISGMLQPLIWLFLFSAIFKNSPMRDLISGAGSYMAFITPGALLFTAFSGALNGGVPILFDRELGFLDRLLVAPLRSRYSIIWATGFHIFVMTLLQVLAIMVVSTAVITTVIGPVGPLIWVWVPPKAAANIPSAMAPYRPATAPRPDCTPKASARGRATIPAVRPPNRSPLRFFRSYWNRLKISMSGGWGRGPE